MFKNKHNSKEKGQGLVEYALILVLVSIVVLGVLLILGPIIGNVFSDVNSGLTVGGGSGGGEEAAKERTSTITYGAAWISPPGHSGTDVVNSEVTWDGACHEHTEPGQSYALLSNGWKPIFVGENACSISISYSY